MGIFTSGVKAAGDMQAAQAQKENADYQAQVATFNSQVADQNANYEVALGEEKAGTQSLKNRAQQSGMIAAQASNGLDVNSGSALSARIGAAKVGAANVDVIKQDAARQAYNYKVQSGNYKSEAGLDVAEGNQDIVAGKYKAAASIASGVADTVSDVVKFAALVG